MRFVKFVWTYILFIQSFSSFLSLPNCAFFFLQPTAPPTRPPTPAVSCEEYVTCQWIHLLCYLFIKFSHRFYSLLRSQRILLRFNRVRIDNGTRMAAAPAKIMCHQLDYLSPLITLLQPHAATLVHKTTWTHAVSMQCQCHAQPLYL